MKSIFAVLILSFSIIGFSQTTPVHPANPPVVVKPAQQVQLSEIESLKIAAKNERIKAANARLQTLQVMFEAQKSMQQNASREMEELKKEVCTAHKLDPSKCTVSDDYKSVTQSK